MSKLQLRGIFLAVILAASAAEAEGQQWSIVGARTVEPKANAVEAGAGWPGVWVAYLRIARRQPGATATPAHGVEGTVRSVARREGAGRAKARLDTIASLPVRAGALRIRPALRLGGWASPCPWGSGSASPRRARLALSVLFDVPMWVEFGVGGGFNVPILTGVGVEYFATSDVGIFARVAVGPTIGPNGRAEFTLDGTLGVGFHF
jgi:hypothetical protein